MARGPELELRGPFRCICGGAQCEGKRGRSWTACVSMRKLQRISGRLGSCLGLSAVERAEVPTLQNTKARPQVLVQVVAPVLWPLRGHGAASPKL